MKAICLTLLSFTPFLINAQRIPEVDQLIQDAMETEGIPSLAVAIIQKGEIVHLSADGFRDLEEKEEATIHTPYHIASVSKIVTNLAIFKLVEDGQLELDIDINAYLPFEVGNPHYPNDKITVAELLNHRSGIRDNHELYKPFWSEPKGDPTLELGSFLEDYLNAQGKLYEKEHYDSSSNHKAIVYSNTGYALLGLIVENVSGTNFEEFCKRNIFEPLQMNNTSWFLKYLDEEKVAKTYGGEKPEELEFKGHNGYPDYPAGQLRTSVSDFSKLMLGYLNVEDSDFILSSKTVRQITPFPRIAHSGFFTWFQVPMFNKIYYSHGGGDVGVNTVTAIQVDSKNGIVIFANANAHLNQLLKEIEYQMFTNKDKIKWVDR